MAESPLELYESAYKLHYVDNDQSRARQVYEEIIKQFPESNEAGYSIIQLQKMSAEGMTFDAPVYNGKSPHPMIIVSVILNFLTLAMIVFAFIAYMGMRDRLGEAGPTRRPVEPVSAIPEPPGTSDAARARVGETIDAREQTTEVAEAPEVKKKETAGSRENSAQNAEA